MPPRGQASSPQNLPIPGLRHKYQVTHHQTRFYDQEMSILKLVNEKQDGQACGTLRTLSTCISALPGEATEIEFIIHNHSKNTWKKSSASDLFYILKLVHTSAPRATAREQIIPIPMDIPPARLMLQSITIDAPFDPGEYSTQIDIVNTCKGRNCSIGLKSWITILTVHPHNIPRRAAEIHRQLRHLLIHSK
jgi:hypothetical protein